MAALRRARDGWARRRPPSRESRAFFLTPPVTTALVALFEGIRSVLAGPQVYSGDPATSLSFPATLDEALEVLAALPWLTLMAVWIAAVVLLVAYSPWILLCALYFAFFQTINHRSLLATVAAFVAVVAGVYALYALFGQTGGDSFSINGCQVIVRGERTPCGWRNFWDNLAYIAGLAAVTAAIFWFIYAGGGRLRLRPDEPWT